MRLQGIRTDSNSTSSSARIPELSIGNHGTAKRDEGTNDPRVDQRSEYSVRSVGRHKPADTSVDELTYEHEKNLAPALSDAAGRPAV